MTGQKQSFDLDLFWNALVDRQVLPRLSGVPPTQIPFESSRRAMPSRPMPNPIRLAAAKRIGLGIGREGIALLLDLERDLGRRYTRKTGEHLLIDKGIPE